MQDLDPKHWLDQLEVTGPIKGIMDFVDELSRNYDKRVAALHIDFQKDVEDMLNCYKQERTEFNTQLEEQKQIIATLESELKAIKQSFHTINVEYKLTKECLDTARAEITTLTNALKREEDLIALTTSHIQAVNQQLRSELELSGVEPAPQAIFTDLAMNVEVAPKGRFKKTRAFFKLVVSDRLTRPIILRPKKQEPIIHPDDVPDNDEYSF